MTLSNGQVVTLNADNQWQATLTGLPKYDSDGEEIEYTRTEASLTNGYYQSGSEVAVYDDEVITTLNDIQIEVPDAQAHTVSAIGLVTGQQEGRTIQVNVTWTPDSAPWATYSNLFFSGWSNTGINAVTSMSGNTQAFVFSGVPTTGASLFVQLGYNGYDLQNNYKVDGGQNVVASAATNALYATGAGLLVLAALWFIWDQRRRYREEVEPFPLPRGPTGRMRGGGATGSRAPRKLAGMPAGRLAIPPALW